MALIDIWNNTPDQLQGKNLRQVIGFAGKLTDEGASSKEFREYLSAAPSELLAQYARECSVEKFEDSGLALQDVVNEIGRRLGFDVTNGRYRGVSGQPGFDGLWRSPDDHSLVVEVKTTDAYRISLDTSAGYRKSLVQSQRLTEDKSSFLFVVGREDTGEFEAQVRGSRYAWDVRLISVDALCRLMKLKEEVEDPATVRRIYRILMPQEFTKVDGIIDLVFTAAEEVRQTDEPDEDDDGPGTRKPKFVPVNFHDACATRVAKQLGIRLLRRSRATYDSPEADLAVICAVSREHPAAGGTFFWYAFHPHQREALRKAARSYVAFGCGSEAVVLLIPFQDFDPWLDGMNMTKKEEREYWHVHIFGEEQKYVLHRKKGQQRID